jgi:hypothetical protein
MLAEARRKAPGAALVRADVRELGSIGRFDLVTCFDDSLNYLLEDADLAMALASAAANLDRHGLFLFDLNTLLAYRTTFAADSVAERDGAVFAWRGESAGDAGPGCRASATIEVFAPREEGLYERVSSRHVQRHHPAGRVTALMEAAGLRCVAIHGVRDDGSLERRPDETRQLKVLYAARRAKGGEYQ